MRKIGLLANASVFCLSYCGMCISIAYTVVENYSTCRSYTVKYGDRVGYTFCSEFTRISMHVYWGMKCERNEKEEKKVQRSERKKKER